MRWLFLHAADVLFVGRAFIFGYSQQILTRIVDSRGSEVREGLAGDRAAGAGERADSAA
jgi:hypothetical protein